MIILNFSILIFIDDTDYHGVNRRILVSYGHSRAAAGSYQNFLSDPRAYRSVYGYHVFVGYFVVFDKSDLKKFISYKTWLFIRGDYGSDDFAF